MTARHPITGAPIRIMRSEAQISRDQKTLVHLDESAEQSPRWTRWSTIISSRDSLSTIEPQIPDYVLLLSASLAKDEDRHFWSGWLTLHAKTVKIVFVSKEAAEILGDDLTRKINIICLDEMYDLYPFIGFALDEKTALLEILSSISLVLRYNRLFISDIVASTKKTSFEKLGGTIEKKKLRAEIVPRIVLIQQFFQHSLNRRSREFKECVLRCISNPLIDEIHLLDEKAYFDEKECGWLRAPKVREYVIGSRLTYAAVFNHIKTNMLPNTIVIFSNSDIYFDFTLRQLYTIRLEKRFLSLLRWDDPNMPQITEDERKPAKIFGPRPDSQDTWIVLSDDITFPVGPDFEIQFGKPGCDNAINVAMLKQRFLICNPAYSIKTYHLHLSAIRDYNPQDVIERPIFFYVDPTAIQEYSVITSAGTKLPTKEGSKTSAVSRKIQYVDEMAAATVMTMLKREKKWIFSHKEDNVFAYETEPKESIHVLENKFTSPLGLVYGLNQIYVAGNEIWKQAWETAETNILATALHVPNLLALWFSKPMNHSIPLWCLHYLSRGLRHRERILEATGIMPEFLVCEQNGIGPLLESFSWPSNQSKVAMVPYDEKLQYWADKLFAVEPHQNMEQLTPVDIETLRSLLPKDVPEEREPNSKGVVVFAVESEDEILSQAWLERIQATTFKGWEVHRIGAKTPARDILSVVRKADVLLGQGGSDSSWCSLAWMWCMRKGSSVIEVMRDIKVTGEHIHLAGISGLRYTLVVAKREPLPIQREHALRDIHMAVTNFCYDIAMTTAVSHDSKPLIILPKNQTGLHEHAGDTFREMVRLWASRGYVRIEESETTPFVWFEGVGKILLYDRPTLRWLDPKLIYEFGLFGNCTPPIDASHKASVWSFWPRAPAAVEKFLAESPLPTYAERKTQSIFLGKVENGVQMKNRTKDNWASVIEKWSMPVDSTGAPYVYTQEEYLREVSRARFGLALAGYGPKCNREIEYFALGTVPICSPEVDMRFYLNPPKEGVHYLRVRSAAEVPNLIASITPEKWVSMSRAGRIWWQENASAEGMFRLTLATIQKVRSAGISVRQNV